MQQQLVAGNEVPLSERWASFTYAHTSLYTQMYEFATEIAEISCIICISISKSTFTVFNANVEYEMSMQCIQSLPFYKRAVISLVCRLFGLIPCHFLPLSAQCRPAG